MAGKAEKPLARAFREQILQTGSPHFLPKTIDGLGPAHRLAINRRPRLARKRSNQ